MLVYAIRHKPTGHYLPFVPRRRGWTNDEPVACSEGGNIPRMFAKKTAARAALRCWLEGRWVRNIRQDYQTGEYDEDLSIVKVETRRAEDMEVVSIQLEEADANSR